MLEKPSFPVDADDEELEQYGVWVKAGPEDIEDGPSDEVLDLQDLDQDSLPEESFLTDEEEDLLSDLETEAVEVADDIPDLDSSTDDAEESEDLEPMFEDLDANESDIEIDLGSDDDSMEDISLEDFDAGDALSSFIEEPDIDEPVIEDLLEEELPQIDEITEELVAEAESSIEELDLDDLPEIDDDTLPPLDEEDFDGIAIPSDTIEAMSLVTEEISVSEDGDMITDENINVELDDFESEDPTMVELEEMNELEDLTISSGDDVTLEIDSSDEESVMDISLEENIELSDLDEDGFEDDSESIDIEHLEGIALEETDAEDLDSDELLDIGDSNDEYGVPEQPTADKNSILSKIENELSAIKTELTTLKDELANLRTSPASSPARVSTPSDDDVAGFFEEVEDETIALTGDELDNILNTADITEEAASLAESEAAAADSRDNELAAEIDDIGEIDFSNDDDMGEIDLSSMEDVDDADSQDEMDALESLDDAILSEEQEDLIDIDEGILGIDENADRLIDRENIIPVIDEIVPPEAEIAEDGVEDALSALDTSEQDLLSELDEPMDLESADTEIEEIADLEEVEVLGFSASEELVEGELEELIDEIPSDLEELDDVLDLSDEIDDPAVLEELEEDVVEIGDDDFGELEEIELPALESAEDIETLELSDEINELEMDDDLGSLEVVDEEDQMYEESSALDLAEEVVEEIEPYDQPSSADEPEISSELPSDMKQEMKSVLNYMDHLLESLPQDKIKEFVDSGHFEVYKKLFDELGLRD